MGFVTVLTVGTFALVGGAASTILKKKHRHDLANILEFFIRLAFIGLFAYILWDLVWAIINAWGGLPRL